MYLDWTELGNDSPGGRHDIILIEHWAVRNAPRETKVTEATHPRISDRQGGESDGVYGQMFEKER